MPNKLLLRKSNGLLMQSVLDAIAKGTLMADSTGEPVYYVINGSYDASTNTPAINTMLEAQIWGVSVSGKVNGVTIAGATTSGGTTYLCAGDRVLYSNGTYTLLNKEITGTTENLTVGTGGIFATFYDVNQYIELRSYSKLKITFLSNTTETQFSNLSNPCNGLLIINGSTFTMTVTSNDGIANLFIISAQNLQLSGSWTIVGGSSSTYNVCSIINANIGFSGDDGAASLIFQNTITSTATTLLCRDSQIVDISSNTTSTPIDAPSIGFLRVRANTTTSPAILANNCFFDITSITSTGAAFFNNCFGYFPFSSESSASIASTWYNCNITSPITNVGSINYTNGNITAVGGPNLGGTATIVNLTNTNTFGTLQGSAINITGNCCISWIANTTTVNATNQTGGSLNLNGVITTLTLGKNTQIYNNGANITTYNCGENNTIQFVVAGADYTKTITTWNGGSRNIIRFIGTSTGTFSLVVTNFNPGSGNTYEGGSNQQFGITVSGNFTAGNGNNYIQTGFSGIYINLTGATSTFTAGNNNNYQLNNIFFTTSTSNNYRVGINNKYVFGSTATLANANFDTSTGWGCYAYYNGAARPAGEPASTFTYAHN